MRAVVDHSRFYLYHSLRSLWREKRRSAFALFCVAVGVASIVGLQTLGFLVADALTGNAQASNRGDVSLVQSGDDFFTSEQMAAFEAIVAEGRATGVTYRYRTQELNASVARGRGAGQGLIVDAFLVDSTVYPFHGQIRALDPLDASLADLLADPHDVVIGKSLADRQDLTVGDQLRVGESGDQYIVRGIVPSGSAVPGGNLSPLLLGFIFLDYEAALQHLDLERTATEVFFTTANPAQATAVAARLAEIVPGAQPRTAEELLEQNEGSSRAIGRLVLVVALSALLIGGLGIANTMLVTVTRRTPEIAVLKALGLKGRQVVLLFLAEAAVLGLMGGLIGLPVGLALSRGLLGLTALFFPAPVVWRLQTQPLVTGLVVGIAVTTVCGFLPALAAAHTRPMRVLQPDGMARPLLGRWQSLVVVLGLTAVLGALAGWLLQDLVVGIVSAYAALVVCSVLISLLWAVVWIIERLPSPRWPSLRLAFRGIGRNRGRAASTLLALIVGLFAISLITVLATSVLDTMENLMSNSVGADLMLVAPNDEAARAVMLHALEQQPGITSFAAAGGFAVELTAINGDRGAYERRIAAYEREQGAPLTVEQRQDIAGYFSHISGRDLRGNVPRLDIAPGMGRNLTPVDANKHVVLLPGTYALAPLGLKPGETLTFRLSNADTNANTDITLEIVGISQEAFGTVSLGGTIIAPYDVLASGGKPETGFFLVNVDQAEKNEIVTSLVRSLPPQAIILETDALVSVLAELVRQITVLPMLVAALAFFAAATMVANTTALVTMERRREIGVMKAVGIRAHQILGQLLLESGILGLVGGLIAMVLVMLTLMLTRAALAEFSSSFSMHAFLPLLALAIGVTLAATWLSAWPASRQRPSNVLRYG